MRVGNSPKRIPSFERLDKGRQSLPRKQHPHPKPKREYTPCTTLATLLFAVSALIFMLAQNYSDPTPTSRKGLAEGLPGDTAGRSSQGWAIARQGFLLGGRGVLQAIGMGVVSPEEQRQVMESLVQSGDDDHESEVVLSVPTKKANWTVQRPRRAAGAKPPPAPAASSNLFIIKKIPLAGFASLPGELALSDNSCPIHGKQTDSGPEMEDCAYGHGFCSQGKCVCVTTYTQSTCSQFRRPFAAHLRAHFEGKFALSASHVRRLNSLKYLLPGGYPPEGGGAEAGGAPGGDHPVGPGAFQVPFMRAGKANRVVWAHLQQGDLAKLDPVLSQALLDLLPGKDPLTNAVFRTCAIVGNSGLSLLFPSEKEIDAHAMVVRLMDAPTKARAASTTTAATDAVAGAAQLEDFPKFVGAKTTFRVLDSSLELLGWHESKDEIRISPVVTKEHFFGHFQYLNKEPDARSYLLDPDFHNYVSESLRAVPSPLAIALFFAVQKCAHVDVYGAHWHTGYGVPETYYGPGREAEAGAKHSQAHELRLLEALAKSGVVTLAHPCAAGCTAESGLPCPHCAPGSACPCGKHSPAPAALPGHCHVAGNLTCFYKCPPNWRRACVGGPGASECPEGMDISQGCVGRGEGGPAVGDMPGWARAGGMKDFDRRVEMTKRQMSRAKGRRKRLRRVPNGPQG